jgi:hypothetical protein
MRQVCRFVFSALELLSQPINLDSSNMRALPLIFSNCFISLVKCRRAIKAVNSFDLGNSTFE